MDCQNYTTVEPERKRGLHLGSEERGAIKVLEKQGYGLRAIGRVIGCVPNTIGNELKRGTPPRKSKKGRPPAIPRSRGRQFTRPTEQTVADIAKPNPASNSLTG